MACAREYEYNDVNARKSIFFWGADVSKSGMKACLSNWFPAEFVDSQGRRFANSEQYMMWRKAILMNDNAIAEKVKDSKIKMKNRHMARFY